MIQNFSTTPPNDDSLSKPIIQLMSTMNQQQMRVRKPSEETKKVLSDLHQNKITNPKSPTLTQVSVQLASDRASPNQYRDLLLISEEPSNKEDSQQLSVLKKQNDSDLLYRKSNFHKSSNSSFSLLYRERNAILTKLILSQQQFKIINDLSAQYLIPFKQYIIYTIKQETINKQIILGIYNLFLIFYLTILLIEIACDQIQISNLLIFHFILFFIQIFDSIYYILIHQFQYYNIILDIINIIPFFIYFQGDNYVQRYLYLIYLLRIKKINKYIFRLNYFIHHYFDYIFIIQMAVQFHFATFITQTIIFLFTEKKQNFISYFENIFMILIKSPEIFSKFLFLVYLFKILLLIFYIHLLKTIFNYKQFTKDSSICYSPSTQKQIIKQIQKQHLFNINELPQYLQNQMKREKYLSILQTIPIFSKSFSKQTLLNICDIIQEKNLKPNQILNQQQCLFIHLEGEIEIVQICESSLRQFKLALIKDKFQIFNNTAFFKNQMQGLQFESISNSKVAFLDSTQFYKLIRKCPREFQKYRMLIDTLFIDNEPYLAKITCLSCLQAHDITQCPFLNYKPNKFLVLSSYNFNKDQKRVIDFKRTQKKKRKLYYKINTNKEDSESFESEEQDKVEPFEKILPSSNSSMSLQNNNNFQLELSSVPYVNYSHSGQTIYSKRPDSEHFLSVQGISSSNSSRKIIQNEIKEVGQSKFQKFGQLDEQSGSSFQYNPKFKIQDSLYQAKQKQPRGSIKQEQFQRFQTDLPQQQQQTRDQRKNQTVVSFENSNYQRKISIEDNILQSFDRISRFDDYFPHYNVDQQITNYQKIQSINNRDSNQ